MVEFKRETVRDVVVVTVEKSDQPGSAGLVELKNLIRRLTVSGTKRFVIDMSALDFLESSGIGVIMGCMRFLADKEAVLIFAALNPNVLMALKVTNLTKVIPYRKSIQECMDAVEKMPLKREMIDRLLLGNPAVPAPSEQPPAPAGRRSSDVVETKAAPLPTPSSSGVFTAPFAAAATATPTATPVEPPAAKIADDWARALDAFGAAQDIFARNSIIFSSDTTFRDAFAALAEKLKRRP